MNDAQLQDWIFFFLLICSMAYHRNICQICTSDTNYQSSQKQLLRRGSERILHTQINAALHWMEQMDVCRKERGSGVRDLGWRNNSSLWDPWTSQKDFSEASAAAKWSFPASVLHTKEELRSPRSRMAWWTALHKIPLNLVDMGITGEEKHSPFLTLNWKRVYIRGAKYVDRDLPINLKGILGRWHGITN